MDRKLEYKGRVVAVVVGEAGSTGGLTYNVERVHEVVLLGGSK